MQQEVNSKHHRNIRLTCPQTLHTEPIQSHTDMKYFTLRQISSAELNLVHTHVLARPLGKSPA